MHLNIGKLGSQPFFSLNQAHAKIAPDINLLSGYFFTLPNCPTPGKTPGVKA
jgi:hypothetical protein